MQSSGGDCASINIAFDGNSRDSSLLEMAVEGINPMASGSSGDCGSIFSGLGGNSIELIHSTFLCEGVVS
jgi:hypothetical protein